MNLLIFKYCSFAILATIINLFIQRLILDIENSNLFFFYAMFFGTLIGLIVKFFLDKFFIFFRSQRSIKANSKMFIRYSIFGVFTTIIFWVIESLFWLIWETEHMREFGAIIGLSIGYVLKYNLDKKYVFN